MAGDWAAANDTPIGGRETTMAMKVDRSALTGTIASEMGEVPFKGTTKGNTLNATFTVDTPNGSFTSPSGEVTGDAMTGTLAFGHAFTEMRKK